MPSTTQDDAQTPYAAVFEVRHDDCTYRVPLYFDARGRDQAEQHVARELATGLGPGRKARPQAYVDCRQPQHRRWRLVSLAPVELLGANSAGGSLVEFLVTALPAKLPLGADEAAVVRQADMLRRLYPAYHDVFVLRYNDDRAARVEQHAWGAPGEGA
jgi:hypothetical protein